jgi:hypothetical protein
MADPAVLVSLDDEIVKAGSAIVMVRVKVALAVPEAFVAEIVYAVAL